MSPPPIRYPLPTLVLVIVLGSLAWAGQGILKRAASAIASPMRRVVNGPDYPRSASPKLGAGGIVRRVLILKDDLPVREKPNLPPADAFGKRGLASIYDFWPSEDTPTHLRIGNGRIVGWVDGPDVLRWDTRLAVKLGIEESPMAVVAWDEKRVEVASWTPGHPWAEVAEVGWRKSSEIPAGAWGVLLTDSEIVALRRASRKIKTSDDAANLRLRAILGTLLEDGPMPPGTRSALPEEAFAIEGSKTATALDTPTEAAATWGGLTFRMVSIGHLP